MGKKNNVNPNHYKTRGRERQGDDIVQEVHKQEYAQAQAAAGEGAPNFMPARLLSANRTHSHVPARRVTRGSSASRLIRRATNSKRATITSGG